MSQWQGQNYNDLQQKLYSPWAQLNLYLTQLFSSQFPTENRASFTLSMFAPTTFLNISSRMSKRGRERVNNLQLQQQIDLFFSPQAEGYTWLKFTNDEVKIHYNHSQALDILGLGKWRPYASFSSTRKFKNSSFKLGAEQKWDHGSIDLRGRYNIGEHRSDCFYYGKLNYQSSLMRASAILVAYSVAKQTWLQKNDVMAAYRLWGDHWAGVVLDSDGFRNYRINYARFGSYFDSLKAVYLYRHERLQAGFLYEYSIEDASSKKMEAAAQYARSNWGVKLRLNSLWEAGLMVKAQLGLWKLQLGSSWCNATRSGWPSFYSLALSYY